MARPFRTVVNLPLEAFNLTIMTRTREILRESLEILRRPACDTFLGRKTQEPFPKEKPR